MPACRCFRYHGDPRAQRHHPAGSVQPAHPDPQPHPAAGPGRVPGQVLVKRAVSREAHEVAPQRLGKGDPPATGIDTTTPGGRLVFYIFGALGQFERDLIQERTRAGLTAAAVRGRKSGRKPVVTDDKLKRACGMAGKGLTVREIATRLKVGKTALYEALKVKPA